MCYTFPSTFPSDSPILFSSAPMAAYTDFAIEISARGGIFGWAATTTPPVGALQRRQPTGLCGRAGGGGGLARYRNGSWARLAMRTAAGATVAGVNDTIFALAPAHDEWIVGGNFTEFGEFTNGAGLARWGNGQ